MILDASSLTPGQTLETDVCIIGGGAAGITLALELSGRGQQVMLLDAGQFKEDPATQALYEGEVADEQMHSPPDKYRQRRFGGSTNIWGGRCMPFDPIDFEARSYVENSGWPFAYQELEPYYVQANALVEAGRYAYSAKDVFPQADSALFDGFQSERVRTDGLERFSRPTNFAHRYFRRLEVSPFAQVVLGANCTGILLEQDGAHARGARFATLAGVHFTVKAKRTVLATGGLETPRLLLASRDVHSAGIGNLHDVVGRYYMCHIAGNAGEVTVDMPTSSVRHGYLVSPDGIYCRRRLALTEPEQRALGVNNVVARLHFPRITDPAHRSGILSGLYLAKNLISYEYGKRLKDGEERGVGTYVRHLANVALDPLDTARFLTHWVSKRTLAARKFPSVVLRNKTNKFSLDLHGEQIPQAQSRITLTSEQDALGMPKMRIDWRYHRADIESIRRTLDVFAEEFNKDGRVRLVYDGEKLEDELMRFGAYGGHHIGTARMGIDPRSSVVDPNGQVHGVANLFVAGSAVFPTSSQANPTLTIVAMSLRLASHIASRDGARA